MRLVQIAFIAINMLIFGCNEVKNNNQVINTEENSMNVENISSQKANEMLQKEDHGIVVIDVRTAKEFGESHIRGAINIDVQQSEFVAKMNELDKNKVYIMHCRSGGRSTNALSMIKNLGFTKIYHINGGILEWQEQKLPLDK